MRAPSSSIPVFFFFCMMSRGGGNGDQGPLWVAPEWAYFSDADHNNSSDPLAAAAAAVVEAAPPPVVGSCSNSPTGLGRPPAVRRQRNGSSSGKQEWKSGGGGGGESSEHETHIWTERERRKKMRTMFSSLHALLPHLSPKADKSTVVDEAVNYIKTLQQKLHYLQQCKLQERLHRCDLAVDVVPPSSSSSSILRQQLPSPASSETTTLITREAFLADVVLQAAAKNGSPSTTATAVVASGAARSSLSFRTWSSPHVVLSVAGDDAHISICAGRKRGLFSAVLCVMEKHGLELVSASVSSDCSRSIITIHARVAGGVFDEFPETTLVAAEISKLAVRDIIVNCLSV